MSQLVRTPKGQVLSAFFALIVAAALVEPLAWASIVMHVFVAVAAARALDAPFLRVETRR